LLTESTVNAGKVEGGGRGGLLWKSQEPAKGVVCSEGSFVLNSLLVALVIAGTVSTATVAGIAAAYGIITGILYAFAYRRARHASTPVLIATGHSAGAD
jgi:hypothetical protein